MANDWGADRLNLSRDEYISMHLYQVVAALNDENHETEKKSSLKSKTDTQFFLEIMTVTNTKQIRKKVVISKLQRPFITNPWNEQCDPVDTLSTFGNVDLVGIISVDFFLWFDLLLISVVTISSCSRVAVLNWFQFHRWVYLTLLQKMLYHLEYYCLLPAFEAVKNKIISAIRK